MKHHKISPGVDLFYAFLSLRPLLSPHWVFAAVGWWFWDLAYAGRLTSRFVSGTGSILPAPWWWEWRSCHGIINYSCVWEKTYFPCTWALWVRACSQWLQCKSQIPALTLRHVCVCVWETVYTPVWEVLEKVTSSIKTIWKLLAQEKTGFSGLYLKLQLYWENRL